MGAGFQVFNNDNIIVIDENYYNLCLVSKGSTTTNNNANNYYVDITLSCREPIIAFKCTSGFAYVLTQRNNGNGTWTFRFGSERGNQVIYYWLFDIPPATSPSNTGMQVFNASGGLVFDANYPYLNPVTIYQDSNGDLISRDITLDGTQGRQYALVQNYMLMTQFVGEEIPGSGTNYNVAMTGTCAKFNSDSNVTLSMKQIYYTITGSIQYRGGGGTACYLLIDVTNF